MLCGPDSIWDPTHERTGEQKSEEIIDYLIYVLKQKGLREGNWLAPSKVKDDEEDDPRKMSPNPNFFRGSRTS